MIFLFEEISVFTNIILPIPEDVIVVLTQAYSENSKSGLIILIAGVVVAASVVEEIIFRGIIQRTLLMRFKPIAVITLTSLIFGAVHFQQWWIIQLVLFAIIAGWLSWRSDSLIPAIMLHISNNLWSLLKFQNDLDISSGIHLQNNHVHPVILAFAVVIFSLSLKKFKSFYIHKA